MSEEPELSPKFRSYLGLDCGQEVNRTAEVRSSILLGSTNDFLHSQKQTVFCLRTLSKHQRDGRPGALRLAGLLARSGKTPTPAPLKAFNCAAHESGGTT
jgi:hypothetical protein